MIPKAKFYSDFFPENLTLMTRSAFSSKINLKLDVTISPKIL